jgi:hypothetical protein
MLMQRVKLVSSIYGLIYIEEFWRFTLFELQRLHRIRLKASWKFKSF